MVGLDAAGVTTSWCKLKLGEVATMILITGISVETVVYKNSCLPESDVEGQDKIRPMWRQNCHGTDGLVRVVDRSDRSRTRRAMRQCRFSAVKQELFDAVAAAEATDKLGLHNSRHRQWFSRSACANAEDGFYGSTDQISRTLSSWN